MSEEDKQDIRKALEIALYAIPLAMAVAMLVLPLFDPTFNISTLVGIAIFCLALAGLNKM